MSRTRTSTLSADENHSVGTPVDVLIEVLLPIVAPLGPNRRNEVARHAVAETGALETAARRTRPCVLVIDDESSSSQLLANIFSEDYEVLFASEGNAALDLAALKLPDMILLDVMMPGIDGYEICRRLKMHPSTSGIPVIFITAAGALTSELKGLELGAVDYISKPIRPDAVRARVNNQIKHKWARDRALRLTELEHALREKRIEALSHMAGGLAHEMSNPLAIIHGRAEDLQTLARGDLPLASLDVQTACESIVRTSDRAIKILRGLRGLAQGADADPMELASIYHVAEECIDLQQSRFAAQNIEVRLSIDPSMPRIECRETQVGQIFTNLLNNAFDAIVQADCEERWIALTADYGDGVMAIDVVDSGPGIEESVRARLMEPFFSTKTHALGMGVGLSLSRTIARDHGGSLVLCEDATPTRFRLTLPIKAATVEETLAESERELQRRLRDATILVVDDEPALREIFGRWFLAAGCGKIRTAENGEAALAVMKAESIDLLITDWRMPVMDGLTLLLRLAESGRSIPSVLLLGSLSDVDSRELFSLGVEAFIGKPFHREDMMNALGKAFAQRSVLWTTPCLVSPTQTMMIPINTSADAVAAPSIRFGRGGFCARYEPRLILDTLIFCFHSGPDQREISGQGVVRWRSEAEGTVGIELVYLTPSCHSWVTAEITCANPQSFIPDSVLNVPRKVG